jgi:hypothetical protein
MRIVSESVVDRSGVVIGDDPSKHSTITNKCLLTVTSLKTGQDYRIEKKGAIA